MTTARCGAVQLNDEASDRVLKVEEEYNKLRKPVYAQRSEVLARIPDFWYQCFVQHPFLAETMTQEDHEIFSYLRQVMLFLQGTNCPGVNMEGWTTSFEVANLRTC